MALVCVGGVMIEQECTVCGKLTQITSVRSCTMDEVGLTSYLCGECEGQAIEQEIQGIMFKIHFLQKKGIPESKWPDYF